MKFNREFRVSDIISVLMIGLMSWLTVHFIPRDEYVRDREATNQIIQAIVRATDVQDKSIALLQQQARDIIDHEARLRALEGRSRVALGSIESKPQTREQRAIQ